MDGQRAPVIAGLVIGSALVLLFALLFPPTASNNSDRQVRDNDAKQVEFPTKYNHTQIPDLHLIVKDDGKRYAGEEGSYCWSGICADYGRIFPEDSITINKGSEIEFRFQSYRTPEIFNVYLSQEPEPIPICKENYDNATNMTTQTCNFSDETPLLTKLGNDFTYRIDSPDGIYRVLAGANWMTEDGHAESDASYFYLIHVK